MASSDVNVMIAAIMKTNEIALRSHYEEKCSELEKNLVEAEEQKAELVICSTNKREELEHELEAVRKEKLEYEEKCNKLEKEVKDLGQKNFHFEEKSESLKKEQEGRIEVVRLENVRYEEKCSKLDVEMKKAEKLSEEKSKSELEQVERKFEEKYREQPGEELRIHFKEKLKEQKIFELYGQKGISTIAKECTTH